MSYQKHNNGSVRTFYEAITYTLQTYQGFIRDIIKKRQSLRLKTV